MRGCPGGVGEGAGCRQHEVDPDGATEKTTLTVEWEGGGEELVKERGAASTNATLTGNGKDHPDGWLGVSGRSW